MDQINHLLDTIVKKIKDALWNIVYAVNHAATSAIKWVDHLWKGVVSGARSVWAWIVTAIITMLTIGLSLVFIWVVWKAVLAIMEHRRRSEGRRQAELPFNRDAGLSTAGNRPNEAQFSQGYGTFRERMPSTHDDAGRRAPPSSPPPEQSPNDGHGCTDEQSSGFRSDAREERERGEAQAAPRTTEQRRVAGQVFATWQDRYERVFDKRLPASVENLQPPIWRCDVGCDKQADTGPLKGCEHSIKALFEAEGATMKDLKSARVLWHPDRLRDPIFGEEVLELIRAVSPIINNLWEGHKWRDKTDQPGDGHG